MLPHTHAVSLVVLYHHCIVIDKTRVTYLEKKYKHMFVTKEIDEGLTQQNPLDDDYGSCIDDLDK
jgi:hypothetical protein